MATAIEFNHVGKQYRLGLVSTKTLSHDIDRWWKTSVLGKEDPYLKIGETNDRSIKGNSDYLLLECALVVLSFRKCVHFI
jgi:lipopolysaccharide transport system ATP-binding protein